MNNSSSSSSPSLFSSLLDATKQPNHNKWHSPNRYAPLSPLLFSTQTPTDRFQNANPTPVLSSTPISSTKIPNTQEFAERLVGLRAINLGSDPLKDENDELKLQSATDVPPTQEFLERLRHLRHDEVIADEASPAFLAMQREVDDLKSELVAARLQLEEKEIMIRELRDEIHARSLQQVLPPPPESHVPAPLPPPPPFADGYQPVLSKKKKKKMKKRQRLEAAVATADTTRPPGCDSLQLPPPPPPPPTQREPPQQHSQQHSQRQQHSQQQQQTTTTLPTLHIYHDSNLKGASAAELKLIMDKINKDNKQQNTSYNIVLNETFTLPQTLTKIRHTSFNCHDAVIINTLTNDARQTKHRQRRSPTQTKQLQTDIIQHLISFIPSNNITILEAPPLLDSPSSDIFPYNAASFSLSHQYGIRFSGTLIGETHLWDDGFHVHKKFRYLLLKLLAAAAVDVNPRSHFKLPRPPYGQYGPWVAPKGQGVMPTYRDGAMAQPLLFRRLAPIRPLMTNIRRVN